MIEYLIDIVRHPDFWGALGQRLIFGFGIVVLAAVFVVIMFKTGDMEFLDDDDKSKRE